MTQNYQHEYEEYKDKSDGSLFSSSSDFDEPASLFGNTINLRLSNNVNHSNNRKGCDCLFDGSDLCECAESNNRREAFERFKNGGSADDLSSEGPPSLQLVYQFSEIGQRN